MSKLNQILLVGLFLLPSAAFAKILPISADYLISNAEFNGTLSEAVSKMDSAPNLLVCTTSQSPTCSLQKGRWDADEKETVFFASRTEDATQLFDLMNPRFSPVRESVDEATGVVGRVIEVMIPIEASGVKIYSLSCVRAPAPFADRCVYLNGIKNIVE